MRPIVTGVGVVTLALFGLMAAPLTLAGQQGEADLAWQQGRMDDARAAYRQVLAQDTTAFVANLRLGLLLGWQGKLDSALALIGRARRADPGEPEARLIEARVLAWHHRYAAAMARYDSALAEQPALPEAKVGRAQVRAWRGDLQGAEREYRAVLASEPRNVEALAGLGSVYHWQGRDGAAQRLASQALAVDSSSESARELVRAVRGAVRAATDLSAGWSDDSDHNTDFWQAITTAAPVGTDFRLLASAGVLEASDPVRGGTRLGGEVGLSWSVGDLQLSGAAGARRVIPETAAARTAATYRGRFGWRPIPRLGASIGYARTPFDEIASLMARDLDLESLDARFDLGIAPGLSVEGSAGAVWFSDRNHRTEVSAGVTQRVSGGLFIGAYGRTMAYERAGLGYFSPDRFRLLEGLAGYGLESGRWSGRLTGALGGQQIGGGGAGQTEWRVELRLGRGWGIGNRADLFGSITNNAASSTSGAFRYGTGGVSVRVGM